MDHLWAPWRMAYINHPKRADGGCFLCEAWADPAGAAERLVAARAKSALLVLNRFPYNCGHLMAVPARHVAALADLTAEETLDLWRLMAAARDALADLMRPDGFNYGVNEGRSAGAGVADHLHVHIVPRWNGDNNYMTVCADARVVPEALADTRARLAPLFAARGLDAETPFKE